jgi:predicted dehydrogenase/nucleoside-diphosphate-sugar epimerase
MMETPLRAGIVGAGYISDFHLRAIGRQSNAELIAICDLNEAAARRLGESCPAARIYSDLDAMLDECDLDVVHVLTQPDSHFRLARTVIEAGCHAVIEKPVTVDSAQAEELAALAQERGVSVAVNHNFVFSRPFNELKAVLEKGELGPLKSVRVVWKKKLAQLGAGPWGLWMLAAPGNILFETGSHSISELLSVIDEIPVISFADARLPKVLPSGSVFYRRWRVAAEAGPVSVVIETAFDQGYEQHLVEVEGMFGVARADIENDVFTIYQPTGRVYDAERLHVNLGVGIAHIRQAARTFGSYVASKFTKSAGGEPYQASMFNGIASCYDELLGRAERRESSLGFAIDVARSAEAILARVPEDLLSARGEQALVPATVAEPKLDARILVVGASGFIGKRLLAALQRESRKVRAIVRNASSLAGLELSDACEVMVGDYRNEAVMDRALEGIEVVIHLAVSHYNSLDGYMRGDSEPTVEFAKRCQQQSIKRFIYLGTIDSLDLATPRTLKESDGVDARIARRNNYAKSKARTEAALRHLAKDEGFPLVIIRPAIVLGAGGPIDHVGVANWFGLGRCAYWGNGENLLPTVLVDDVVDGIVSAIDAEGIEGRSYNLSSDPCLSARDYVAEFEKVLGAKVSAGASSALGYYLGDMLKWVVKVLARHPDRTRIPSLHDWKCRQQLASFDTTSAREDLGWNPAGDRDLIIEKGIREPALEFLDG